MGRLQATALGMAFALAVPVGVAQAVDLPAPGIPTPNVPVPSVPVPNLPVPSVPVPSVPAPSVPAPSVPAPSAPVPSAPSVPGDSGPSLPGGSAPSVGGGGTSGGGSSGGGRSGGGVLGGLTVGGASGGGSSGGGGSPSGGGGGAGADARGGGGGSARAAGRRGGPRGGAARTPRSRSERRLRRAVRERTGCLAALAPTVRRVLVLRAGVHGAAPHSRARVAVLLDLSTPRVVRLERRGVRTLRRLDSATGCGGNPRTVATTGVAVLTGAGAPVAPARASGAAAAGGGGGGGGDGGGASSRASSGGSAPDGESGGVLGETAEQPAIVQSPAPPSDGTDLTLYVIALAVLAAIGVGLRRARQGGATG